MLSHSRLFSLKNIYTSATVKGLFSWGVGLIYLRINSTCLCYHYRSKMYIGFHKLYLPRAPTRNVKTGEITPITHINELYILWYLMCKAHVNSMLSMVTLPICDHAHAHTTMQVNVKLCKHIPNYVSTIQEPLHSTSHKLV